MSAKISCISIPITATYTVRGDAMTLTAASYVEVQTAALARLLLGHFNIPVDNGAQAFYGEGAGI